MATDLAFLPIDFDQRCDTKRYKARSLIPSPSQVQSSPRDKVRILLATPNLAFAGVSPCNYLTGTLLDEIYEYEQTRLLKSRDGHEIRANIKRRGSQSSL